MLLRCFFQLNLTKTMVEINTHCSEFINSPLISDGSHFCRSSCRSHFYYFLINLKGICSNDISHAGLSIVMFPTTDFAFDFLSESDNFSSKTV